jgi:hypothetical protein
VIAAITLWNTVYLERAVNALRERGAVNDALLGHIAPLGWNHIELTGDYNWHANKRVAKGGFRPLRRVRSMVNGRRALTYVMAPFLKSPRSALR